jgi:hemerythrin-like domain-containing protein
MEIRMKATDILKQEHRIIERMLASLEQAADRLEQGGDVPPHFFITAADFSARFADGCHHRKEENVLFQAMIERGMPRNVGPIAVMMAEHEQGRAYTQAIRVGAERLQAGDADARLQLILNARGYVALLRQHITKEDTILFRMADQAVPAADQERLAEEFERIEREEVGSGAHQKYLAVVEALEKEAAR